jgi:hypothetical protein
MSTHRSRIVAVGGAVLVLALGGCATTDVANFPGTAEVLASSRLLEAGPELASSSYQDAVDRYAGQLASGGLSVDDAVAIAALNATDIKALLAKENLLGAKFVDGVVAARGEKGAAAEWIVVRKALVRPANGGERQAFGIAYAEAAGALVPVAAAARAAWVEAVAARQVEAVMRSVTDSLKVEADLANEQYRAGTLSRGDHAKRQLALAAALREHATAARDAVAAREKLVRTLGLWGAAADVKLPDRLPDLPERRPTFTDVETYAVTHRLDLVLARHQGGARAKAIEVRSEVREAEAALLLAYDAASHQQKVVLPESQAALEAAQREYNGMLIGVYDLLEGVRTQIEAGRGYVETLRDYWLADAAFRAAVGGELPDQART